MKRLLLLIAVSIVWSGSVLQAQEYEYVPLVQEGVEWGYYQYNPVHPENNGFIRLQFEGDTLLDGKTYKKLYMYKGCDFTSDRSTLVDFMREENKTVYSKKERKDNDDIYGEDVEEEIVLYDFSLNVGDSLWIPSYYEYEEVTRIDTVKVGNTYRKQFYINNRTSPIWMEKPCDFDPFGQTGLSPFGYNMIDPLKSWCWGSILFYPFKISRFS